MGEGSDPIVSTDENTQLTAVVELIVHIESFRNVDLFSQGLYSIRTYIYTAEGHKMAIPFTCVGGERDTDLGINLMSLFEPRYSAHVDHDKQAFSTRSFVVRFREQLVDLNDIGYFRLELPVSDFEIVPGDDCFFEFEMRFIDLTAQKVKDNPDNAEFKNVGRQVFKVANIASGVHKYIPVTFDEMHFCQMNVLVHSSLVDYRLKPVVATAEVPTRHNIAKRLRQRFKPKNRRFFKLYKTPKTKSNGSFGKRRTVGSCMSACSRPDGGHNIDMDGSDLRPHVRPGSSRLIHRDFAEALQTSLHELGDSHARFSKALKEYQPGAHRRGPDDAPTVPNLETRGDVTGQHREEHERSGSDVSDTRTASGSAGNPPGMSKSTIPASIEEATRLSRAVSVSDVVPHTPRDNEASAHVRGNETENRDRRGSTGTQRSIHVDSGQIAMASALIDPEHVLHSPMKNSAPAVTERPSPYSGNSDSDDCHSTHTVEDASAGESSTRHSPVPYQRQTRAKGTLSCDPPAFMDDHEQSRTRHGSPGVDAERTHHDMDPVAPPEGRPQDKGKARLSTPITETDPSISPHDNQLPEYISLNELHIIAMSIYRVWHELAGLFHEHPVELTEILASSYRQSRILKWNESVARETYSLSDLTLPVEDSEVNAMSTRAAAWRKVINSPLWLPLEVENMADYNQPITFEYRYRPEVMDMSNSRNGMGSRTSGESSDHDHEPSASRPITPFEAARIKSDAAKPGASNTAAGVPAGITSTATSAAWTPPATVQTSDDDLPSQPPLVRHPSTAFASHEHYAGCHLFVFVHGFQGNPYDLRLIKDFILMSNPGAEFLLSHANRNNTMQSIEEMGKLLADEIRRHIHKKRLVIGRLSFVCHSLGSVIARAALQCDELRPFRTRMYLYMSLSGPHLGIVYNQNALLNSAMWIMRRSKKSVCLSQLSLTDADNPEDTFLYKLSLQPTFEYFRHVALVSSPQDRYVPIHSSRMEICANAMDDTKGGSIYIRMVHNIFSRLQQHSDVTRYSVFFDMSRSLDSAIGRAAHIEFLENITWMEMFVDLHPQLFS